jgi:predicted nuclease of predicted toxin-antitoxin system
MKLLLDMNLAPSWVGFLQGEGFEAVHWSTVGDPRASDASIMEWARRGGYVVFTHDLDFSALLAATEATGPSVLQVRTQDILHDAIGRDIVRALRMRAVALEQGAIVTIDKVASRVRVLPIRRPSGGGEELG